MLERQSEYSLISDSPPQDELAVSLWVSSLKGVPGAVIFAWNKGGPAGTRLPWRGIWQAVVQGGARQEEAHRRGEVEEKAVSQKRIVIVITVYFNSSRPSFYTLQTVQVSSSL